jgi:FkbM family methyltransferase
MSLQLFRNETITRTRFVQAVVRRAYPIGKIRAVHRGPLKGLRFRVASGMGFTYAWGIGVEQWDFSGLIQPGMSVYDIGANCGQSTLRLAMLVGKSGRVVAFEPVECLFANLVFNLELNSLLQVTPVCAAASEQNGELNFLFNDGVATQGRLAHVEPSCTLSDATTISVRAMRLDNYALDHWPVPRFLKIDVEGGARAVLQGAEGLLTNHRPTIYIELHGPEEQEAVYDLLTSFRYQAETLSGLVVKDPTAGWFSPLVCRPL